MNKITQFIHELGLDWASLIVIGVGALILWFVD